MMEYINQKETIEKIRRMPRAVNPDLVQYSLVKGIISGMPAADVAPVVHGHWFFTEYEFFTCSVCGGTYYNGAESTDQAKSYLNSGNVHKYCPNCGAKMDQ